MVKLSTAYLGILRTAYDKILCEQRDEVNRKPVLKTGWKQLKEKAGPWQHLA